MSKTFRKNPFYRTLFKETILRSNETCRLEEFLHFICLHSTRPFSEKTIINTNTLLSRQK